MSAEPLPPFPEETVQEPARRLPVRARTDVVVCGGGPAGVCAALAAARQGARVCLLEQHGFAGGAATAAGVNGIGGWQYDLDGSPLVRGLPLEIMARVAALGGADAVWVRRLAQPRPGGPDYRDGGLGCYWIQTHPECLKLALDELLVEAGVEFYYHAAAVRPLLAGNRVLGVCMESKSGREAVLADVVVDATGDGDIAARAGAESALGRPGDHACQPMTLIYTAANAAVRDMNYRAGADESGADPLARNRYEGAVRLARERGEITLNPNDIFCAATPVVPSEPGIRSVNFTRVQRHSAVDAAELTRAEVLGRRQVHEAVAFMRRYVHGCENAVLVHTAPHIGIRESRRILGDHLLTGDEILAGTAFPDSVARGIYLLDIHNPSEIGKPSMLRLLDQPYGIPYRCLLPRGLDGLLTAGRCISGDATALASYRIMSHCMALGQAAGTAAALAARAGISPRALDAMRLRRALADAGANPGATSSLTPG